MIFFTSPVTRSGSSPSFALISVLALVSLAALTATAFLASARLERRATMSIADTTRLELALHSGGIAAAEMVDLAVSEQFSYITTYWRDDRGDWTNELGYLLNGAVPQGSSARSTTNTFWACFSTATFTNLVTNATNLSNITNLVASQGSFRAQMTNFMAQMTNFRTNSITGLRECTNIPIVGHSAANPHLSPPVGWVYINQNVRTNPAFTNTVNIPVARFAFYVQDLSSLIDVQRMGGFTNSSFFRSTNFSPPAGYVRGTNPEEISILDAAGTSLFGNTNKTQLLTTISNRITYLSPGMLTLSNAGRLTTNDLRYFTTGLLAWTNAWERIPPGLGYNCTTNNRNPLLKTNLEILLSSVTPTNKQKILQELSTFITNNLTNFPARAGARINTNQAVSTAYVQNIAANIMDYYDQDSDPTVDSTNNPSYLGIENLPWPNEIFDRIMFTDVTAGGLIRIQLKDYVEVWNMGSQPITTGTSIAISNNYDLVLTMTNTFAKVGFTTNLMNFSCESGEFGLRIFTLISDLPPNGYQVLESSTDPATRRLSIQLTNPSLYANNAIRNAWAIYADSNTATTNMAFSAYYKNVKIQTTKDGRWTRYLTTGSKMSPPNGKYIFCNNIGFASQTNISAVPAHSGGDPRAQIFLAGALYNQNYTNRYASPGGRNVNRYWIDTFPESQVNPLQFWPDGGHLENDGGGNPTSFEQSPTTFTNTPAPKAWVMKRNDRGPQSGGTNTLTNIIELGNIYDPMQWGDSSRDSGAVASQPGLWMNLTTNATNDARFGGRNTLRVGRWEFSRFAFTRPASTNDTPTPNMSISSAALLDLFCVYSNFSEGGRINLNTAPAPVLTALAGGVFLTNDPAATNPYRMSPSMAEAFAQGVMRFRARYPFYSPSQLAFISTSSNGPGNWPSNAVFGNTNPIFLETNFPSHIGGTNTSNNISAWNDPTAEEWFANIYGLSTTYSRNYRCYVLAQLCDSNKIGKGPVMRKYYNILVRQNEDASTNYAPNCSTYIINETRY